MVLRNDSFRTGSFTAAAKPSSFRTSSFTGPGANPSFRSNRSVRSNPVGNTRNRRGILVSCLTAYFLSMSVLYQMSPYFQEYAEAKAGVSTTEVGIIFAILPFASFFASIPSGYMVTKLGINVVLNGGLLGLAATSLAFGLSESVEWWLFWRTLQGLASAPVYTAISCALAQAFTGPNEFERVSGYQEAAANLGVMLAPFIGGALYEFGGFFMPFAVNSACQVLFVLVNIFVPQGRQTQDSAEALLDEDGNAAAVGLWDVCYWQVFLVASVGGVVTAWFGATEPYMAQHYQSVFPSIGTSTVGALMASSSILSILGAVAVPNLPFRSANTTGFGLFLLGIISCALGWSDPSIGDYSAIHYGIDVGSVGQWVLQLVLALLIGAAWALAYTLVLPMMMDLATGRLSKDRGGAEQDIEVVSPHVSSISNMAMFFGEAMGPSLGGAWITQVGWGVAFASLGAFCALWGVLFSILLCRTDISENADAESAVVSLQARSFEAAASSETSSAVNPSATNDATADVATARAPYKHDHTNMESASTAIQSTVDGASTTTVANGPSTVVAS